MGPAISVTSLASTAACNNQTNPIPAEITRLTGITDEMVAGQMIDIGESRALIEPADLVIAHNPAFVFAEKAWACSVSEIDWARAISKAPARLPDRPGGLLPRGPQGLDDCFALLEVLSQGRGELGDTPFAELYTASQRSRVRIFAKQPLRHEGPSQGAQLPLVRQQRRPAEVLVDRNRGKRP
ncbi:hypothetical protein EV129_117115 [Rhizobium azibense]|uniref:Uncharacterized protein n=1 Tax=Rhizobium azibense TaxID=1136135 RepID=A0A4R3RCE9_9HYPH|nr:hypothetical protein EV129_117115 [Rhizobium azibense]